LNRKFDSIKSLHGKVRYQLKTPYRDGTTGDWRSHAIFEPLYFIARLAALRKPH
jgi:hypothetical protein